MSTRDKVLSSILGLLLLAAIGAVVYTTYSAPIAGRFTEFYILGPNGKVEGYPEELVQGEEGKVLLEIVNHEYQEVRYRVEIRLVGVIIGRLGPVTLQHGQKWESEADFIPEKVGENQKVEFLLYKEGESEPYSSLYLWLDVRE